METITIFWIVAIVAIGGALVWYFMSGKKEPSQKKEGFQVPPTPVQPEEKPEEKAEEPKAPESEDKPEF